MPQSRPAGQRKGAFKTDPALARRVGFKRLLARLVLFAERLLPLFLPVAGIAALFVSLAWFGVYRELPEYLRLPLVFVLIFALVASLLPFLRLKLPTTGEADRLLEERNGLPHQPVAVQDDEPAFETPFARALWQEHQRRMAERIAALDTGLPQPDIARFDRYALRAIPALLFVTALAYSGSNGAGTIADAFRQHVAESQTPDMRIDAWITPPAYTGQAPVFLSGLGTQDENGVSVPQHSKITVRISGGAADEKVLSQGSRWRGDRGRGQGRGCGGRDAWWASVEQPASGTRCTACRPHPRTGAGRCWPVARWPAPVDHSGDTGQGT